MRRTLLYATAVGLITAVAVMPSTAGAQQEADVNASCMGIVSSRIDPGEHAYIAHLTQSAAPTLGFKSPGDYTSYFAHFHRSEIGPECS